MSRSRAFRRHQYQKAKRRAKNVIRAWRGEPKLQEFDERELGMVASCHGAVCSCHMCGNPRKYYKEKTMQEKRIEDHEKDGRKDLGE